MFFELISELREKYSNEIMLNIHSYTPKQREKWIMELLIS